MERIELTDMSVLELGGTVATVALGALAPDKLINGTGVVGR